MSTLTIKTLGEPRVLHDGVPCPFAIRKVLALTLYLAVTGRAHTRVHLMTLLWPEADEVRGQQNLRQALRRLRQELAPDEDAHLLTTDESVRLALGPDGGVDVTPLHAATLSQTSPEQRRIALRGYGGGFLTDFSLDDAPDFMEWVMAQRAHWEARYDLLASQEMQRLLDASDIEESHALGQQWVVRRPDHEDAYRLLATAQAMTENVSGAHLTLTTIARRLEELGLTSSPEMQALRERLSTLTPPHSVKHDLRIPFVGRQDAFRQMRQAFQEVRVGKPGMIIVQGEAGLGKSRLVEVFASWAAMQGADVAIGHAYELSGRLPYHPLMELLRQRLAREHAPDDLLDDSWLAELQRLAPELHDRYPDLPLPVEDATGGARLLEAITQMGLALARQRPLVWLIEDVQWADEATRDGILYLRERWNAEQVPALLIGTMRREDLAMSSGLSRWLTAAHRVGGVTEVALSPLDAQQTTQAMMTLFVDTPSQRLCEWLYAETQGNPLYLMHVIQALADRGLVLWEDVTPRMVADLDINALAEWLPETLRGVLLRRVRRLDENVQQVLAAASVVGTRFAEDVLLAVTGIADDLLVSTLETAEQSSLIRADGAFYVFTHDKVAEAIYGELTLARRRMFHRRALQMLMAAMTTPPAELLRHAVAAAAWEDAIRYGQQAAEAANQIGAHLDALRFYEQIVYLLSTPPSQATLQAAVGDEARVDLYELLGLSYLNLGKKEQARALYQSLLVESRASGARHPEGRALIMLGRLASEFDHDPLAAQSLLEQGFQVAQHCGDIRGQTHSMIILTVTALADGDVPRAQGYISQGIQIARNHSLISSLAQCLNILSEVAIRGGDWEHACAAIEESIVLFAAITNGATSPETSPPYAYTLALSWSAFLPEIAVLLRPQPTRTSNRARQWGANGLTWMGVARLHIGEGACGRAALEVAWQIFTERNEQRHYHQYLAHRTIGWLEEGHYERALQETRQILMPSREATDIPSDITAVGPYCALIDAYHALLFLDETRAILDQATAFAANKPLWDRLLPATRWCTYHALRGEWGAAYQATLVAQEIREATPTQRNGFDFARYYETEALLRADERERASADTQRFASQLGTNRRYRLVWLRMQALLDRDVHDHSAAIAHLTEALAFAESMGLPGEMWQIALELATSHRHAGDAHHADEMQARAAMDIENLATQIADDALRAHFTQAARSRRPSLS